VNITQLIIRCIILIQLAWHTQKNGWQNKTKSHCATLVAVVPFSRLPSKSSSAQRPASSMRATVDRDRRLPVGKLTLLNILWKALCCVCKIPPCLNCTVQHRSYRGDGSLKHLSDRGRAHQFSFQIDLRFMFNFIYRHRVLFHFLLRYIFCSVNGVMWLHWHLFCFYDNLLCCYSSCYVCI